MGGSGRVGPVRIVTEHRSTAPTADCRWIWRRGSGECEDGGGEARHRHAREPHGMLAFESRSTLVSIWIVYEGTEDDWSRVDEGGGSAGNDFVDLWAHMLALSGLQCIFTSISHYRGLMLVESRWWFPEDREAHRR